jgi:diguanylate cyclase (GGDEF)-like protein/PAS domain S-box-containing protein
VETPPGLPRADAAALIVATFDSAPDGIVVLDATGRALLRNAQFLALWQFPAEMLARGDSAELREYTAGQLKDPARYRRSLPQLLATRETVVLDEHELRDGRVLERHVSPLSTPGLEGCLVVRWRDVTARSQAQARQRELAALLDLAMLSAQLAYWDVDLVSSQVHSINDECHRMLGYARHEVDDSLQAWAQLVHPDDAAARRAAWDAHVQGRTPRYEAEFRMRHRQGQWVWILARGQAVSRDADGRALRMVGTRTDVTEHKLSQERLARDAQTDGLTGVANRRHLLQHGQAMLDAAWRQHEPLALLMLDLDHFKAVNDRLGHAAGDEVLKHFVACVRAHLRERDLVGRLGGEEFVALLHGVGPHEALTVARRVVAHVRERPARVGAQRVPYTVSVGVAVDEPTAQATAAPPLALQALMARADRALYAAKGQGRDRAVLEPAEEPPAP